MALCLARTALFALLVAGCSAPALSPELSGAEQAETRGDHERALGLYDAALARCAGARPPGPDECRAAHLGRAELLETMGRLREAARDYEAVPAALPRDSLACATATYRAGRLYLELGEDVRAYTLLWRVVTDYPDEAFAADALAQVVRDGRKRNAAQLYEVLATLVQPLAATALGDNLLYVMAELAERERNDRDAALAFYDKLAVDFPKSGLRDDALWHGARLARALGQSKGAVRRLQSLLATREVAIGAGSYFSVWLDNGQIELGRVLRDDLGDLHGAARAFADLPGLYPASVLIDDALWELAVTRDLLQDREQTCSSLARLRRDWPDSKYWIERAPALARKHGCP